MDDKFDRNVNPDFIEVIDGCYDKEFCDKLIKLIDKQEEMGLTATRNGHEGVSDEVKSDTFMFLNQTPLSPMEELEKLYGVDSEKVEEILEENQVCHWAPPYSDKFNRIFWNKAHREYAKKYSMVNNLPEYNNPYIKLQKTRPTEGYHVWHSEHGPGPDRNRLLVWMLYLNDDFEAGETEFLYQAKRVKPKTGRIVIWPAGFTHTHRGNPPIGGTKYAATGWLFYKDPEDNK